MCHNNTTCPRSNFSKFLPVRDGQTKLKPGRVLGRTLDCPVDPCIAFGDRGISAALWFSGDICHHKASLSYELDAFCFSNFFCHVDCCCFQLVRLALTLMTSFCGKMSSEMATVRQRRCCRVGVTWIPPSSTYSSICTTYDRSAPCIASKNMVGKTKQEYHQISNKRFTKSQKLNVSYLILQQSFFAQFIEAGACFLSPIQR